MSKQNSVVEKSKSRDQDISTKPLKSGKISAAMQNKISDLAAFNKDIYDDQEDEKGNRPKKSRPDWSHF